MTSLLIIISCNRGDGVSADNTTTNKEHLNITMVTVSLPVAKVAILFVGMSSPDTSVSVVALTIETRMNS